jgi:hypothetical protein
VVIGTDYIGSSKSNYHTITTTTAPSNGGFVIPECISDIDLPILLLEENKLNLISLHYL